MTPENTDYSERVKRLAQKQDEEFVGPPILSAFSEESIESMFDAQKAPALRRHRDTLARRRFLREKVAQEARKIFNERGAHVVSEWATEWARRDPAFSFLVNVNEHYQPGFNGIVGSCNEEAARLCGEAAKVIFGIRKTAVPSPSLYNAAVCFRLAALGVAACGIAPAESREWDLLYGTMTKFSPPPLDGCDSVWSVAEAGAILAQAEIDQIAESLNDEGPPGD